MHCPTFLVAFETKRSNLLDQNKILKEIQEIKQAVAANAHDIKKFSHCNQDIGSTCQKAAPSHDLVSKRLRFKGLTESTSKEPFQRQIDGRGDQPSGKVVLVSSAVHVKGTTSTGSLQQEEDAQGCSQVGQTGIVEIHITL